MAKVGTRTDAEVEANIKELEALSKPLGQIYADIDKAVNETKALITKQAPEQEQGIFFFCPPH